MENIARVVTDYQSGFQTSETNQVVEIAANRQSIIFEQLELTGDLNLEGDLCLD